MHVNEIAKYSNINPDKLGSCLVPPSDFYLFKHLDQQLFTARVLRLLATNHIFKEVAPNVFAHNRISRSLDTGKDGSVLAQSEYELILSF